MTMKSGLAIVVAVAIGAVVTWLWTSRAVVPAAGGTAQRQSVAPPALAVPKVAPRSGPRPDGRSGQSRSVAPSLVDTVAPAADDSTYYRMLAVAQSLPSLGGAARRVTEMHESFLLTPDDLEWGRRTEQALRDFFRVRSADNVLEITSVSCRSAGCEVQAESKPMRRLDVAQSADDAEQERVRKESLTPLLEGVPDGGSLRHEVSLILDLGDRSGFFITYKRIGAQ